MSSNLEVAADGERKASTASSRRHSAVAAKKKPKKEVIDKDNWDAVVPEMDTGPGWGELTGNEKIIRVLWGIGKIVAVLTFLYFFICSLTLLSNSFKLIAGKNTSALTNNKYVKNPIVALIVGILLTVLVQSSSTSTSIIVSMVSAGMLQVQTAIPIIMGSNVGTSVTNTLVSLTQAGDRAIFRRAFAGGTVHDMFNWLTVIVLLIVELTTHMLLHLTGAVVDSLLGSGGGSVAILTRITNPFTDLIVQLDEQVMNCWAVKKWDDLDSIMRRFCDYVLYTPTTMNPNASTTWHSTAPPTTAFIGSTNATSTSTISPTFYRCPDDKDLKWFDKDTVLKRGVPDSCTYMFQYADLSNTWIGVILLIISLAILAGSLIGIVKVLSSMLKGSMAGVINRTLNADVPYVPWLTGYIAILVGAFMTFIIQSSSIFTSTLTPLIGLGVLSVERAYPLCLGSNIGTTTTALLASLASPPSGIKNAIQIALVHLFFNCIGICIWYPIPFMRLPIFLCKILGNTTAEYRWFALLYLFGMFLVFPVVIFALDVAGDDVLFGVFGPILVIIVFAIIMNILQAKCPQILPRVLRDWMWLPEPLRSLDPYDRFFMSLACCNKFGELEEEEELEEVVSQPGSRKPSQHPESEHRKQSSSSSDSSHSSMKKGIDNKAMVKDE